MCVQTRSKRVQPIMYKGENKQMSCPQIQKKKEKRKFLWAQDSKSGKENVTEMNETNHF